MNIARASLLCGAVGIAVYLNTLGCGLCYDDNPGIIENADLRANVSWSNLLWNDFWGTPMNSSESHKSYRPLCVATFKLNYLLHELQPMGYHLVNVLLHGAVCYLYVQLCGVIFSEVWPALIAGLLFAVHPIHTEAVASVVGRADVLSGLFFVATLLCYRKTVQCASTVLMLLWLAGSMMCCVFALVSKETGFTVVAACVVYDFFVYHQMNLKSSLILLQNIPAYLLNSARNHPNSSSSHSLRWLRHFFIRTTLFGSFALITAFLRLRLNNGSPSFTIHDNPPMTYPSPWRQLQWLHLCFVNIWLMFNPFTLSCDWRMGAVPKITSFLSIWNLATVATLLSICALGLYSISTSTKHSKHILVSLSLIIFPYIPASNLFFVVGFYVAERILYIPSMGVCILVSCSVWHLLRSIESKHMRAIVWLAIGSILITYSAKTLHRNRAWNSNYDLYTAVLPVFPDNALMINNLGVEISKKDLEKGTSLLKTAAELAPNVTLPHLALARVYRENDQWEEAEKWYRKAALLAHTDQKANHLATIYYELGLVLVRNQTTEVPRLKKALKLFSAALSIPSNPKMTDTLHNKGYALLKLNQFHEAREALEKVLKDEPDHLGATYKLGEVFLGLGDLTRAEYFFRRALSMEDTNILAKFHLAALAIKTKSTKERLLEARQLLNDVLEVEPTNSNAMFALGVVEHSLGEVAKAKTQFEETVRLNSTNTNAMYNLGFVYMEETNYTAAKNMLLKLLDLKPDHYTGKVQLASCHVRMGDLEKGVELYEEVLENSNDNSAISLALSNLGAVKQKLGHLEESVELLTKAVAMDPGNKVTMKNLSKAQQQLKLQTTNTTKQ